MADEKTPEEIEETPEAEGVSDTEVSDTVSEETEPAAEAAEVSDTVSEETEPAAEAAEVSDTVSEETEPAAEAAEVSDTVSEETEPAAEAAPAKKQRSRKHVPRAQRRTRTRPKRETSAKRKPITRTAKPESERGRHQERRGVVVSDKGDKTIVVKVDVIKIHPKYKKVIRRTVKFHAHDEANSAGVGDTVRIIETRPLSKTKHWRLAEVVERAK